MSADKPYTGGCACGAVRYAVAGEPLMMNDCQCRHCQQRSGTGHGSYLTFKDAAVTVSGQASTWRVTGDLGTVKGHNFCPTCGTPTHLTFPAMPEIFIVHAGSLDEPERYQPTVALFAASGHAWDTVAPGAHRFERMPD
jgi:hypothetical protein